MSLRNRIIGHGLLAALPLAVIGYGMSQLAGMWVAAQTAPRHGPMLDTGIATTASGDDVADALLWKLPLFMALGGFAFVALGELLLHAWRRPKT